MEINPGMIGRWKREFAARSGGFNKKKVLSLESQELKA
jgi:transposase